MPAAPTLKLGPFTAGIDNRARDFALPADAFRDAVNIDLSNTGNPRRRNGIVEFIGGQRVHSLWAPADESAGYFMRNGTLSCFNQDGTTTDLKTGLSPIARMAFCEVPGRGIAFSNGQTIGRIVNGAVRPFALSASSTIPTLTVASGGALLAGQYEVLVTHVDAFGEESGVIASEYVTVPDSGKITVTLPPPFDAVAVKTRVYVSARNSGSDFLHAELPVGTTSYDITVASDDGGRVRTHFLMPLPAGSVLAFFHGRTYSAVGSFVFYTEPYSGQHSPLANYIPMPGDVSIMAPMPDGLFIVADKTYWLPGDTARDGGMRVVAETTGVLGTLTRRPGTTDLMWFSPRGLVVAQPGGQLSFPNERRVAVQPANEGASLYREDDGLKQVITTLRNPGSSTAGARSWFTVKMGSRETRNET